MQNTEQSQIILQTILQTRGYSKPEIEASLVEYILNKINYSKDELIDSDFKKFINTSNKEIVNIFEINSFPIDIEAIIDFFEALLEQENITENGIVFTPMYIADYISENVLKNLITYDENIKILDPGCGCGIFLIAAINWIRRNFNVAIDDIIRNNIYGFDLDENNVERCKIVLRIYGFINRCDLGDIKFNIAHEDSLKVDWTSYWKVNNFDFIIGNPPYVNTHDMSKETSIFLKNNFVTTQKGVYNIFYAFIEHGLKFIGEEGLMSYIVPNNFLTIKSAEKLRDLLQKGKYLETIIDFGENMVFKPIMTYNCIIVFSKQGNNEFVYNVMEKVESVENELKNVKFEVVNINRLDKEGWKLVDHETYINLSNIETQFRPIKEFIRTGIATLKDDAYLVEKEINGFYKMFNGEKYIIERDLVKKIYKIPDLKFDDSLERICKYIIFPYKKGINGFEIIPEEELINNYSLAYKYLRAIKSILDSRDKGKPNKVSWYAYGRTQGLNKYGNKIVFPTFANYPKFMILNDEYALFCNGYAVFENDYLDLDILVKVLNSTIMNYYIQNTSYTIEGGYYCYQKKYIENFSIPLFSDEETDFIRENTQDKVNEFLIKKYNLSI